ncbi:hypothetical protein GLA29479_1748 [Lysobacter antibioticus]|nr:hypothetical protein GLA29479_1748 [Lysobacter antibioticus]
MSATRAKPHPERPSASGAERARAGLPNASNGRMIIQHVQIASAPRRNAGDECSTCAATRIQRS